MNDNDTTDNYQLNYFGRKYFGNKYRGTYVSNHQPILKQNQCCILNTDDHKSIGTHWIALYMGFDNNIYFYDSFGRQPQSLSKYFSNDWIQSNNNIEQNINTQMCGQICLSWLMTVYQHGIDNVYIIL